MFGTIGFGFSASGSGGGGGGIAAVTANNGLTATTISNVQFGSTTTLGVPLLHNTYLNLGNFGFTINGGASATFNLLINDTGVSKAEIISDSTAFVMQTTTNATNTVSGLDITSSFGGAGSIRRTDTVTGLYTGLYYLGSEVGWNVNNGVTQFEYHFPPAPYVASSLLADISGTGFLTWATISSVFGANNGLTKSSATNVELGGTLLKSTVISATGFTLTLQSNVNSYAFISINTSTYAPSGGIKATGYYGILAEGTQEGVRGTSVNGIAIHGLSTNSAAGAFESVNATALDVVTTATNSPSISGTTTTNGTNDIKKILRLTSLISSSFIPANGIGGAIEFYASNTISTGYLTNRLISKWTDVITATRTSQFEITSVNSAVESTTFTIKGTGQTQLNKYGIGNFTGTQTYNLGVDSLGNVTETLNTTTRFGSFYDTTIQTQTTANTALPMKLNSTDLAATSTGVSIANNLSGNPTRITVNQAGVYNLQFSTQIDRTAGSGFDFIYIWIQVNGVTIPNSAGKTSINSNSDVLVDSWNWFVTLAANQYVEIMWSVSDNRIRLLAETATAPAPEIPSVIATIYKV